MGLDEKSPGIASKCRRVRRPRAPHGDSNVGPYDSSRVRMGLDNAARINTLHISLLNACSLAIVNERHCLSPTLVTLRRFCTAVRTPTEAASAAAFVSGFKSDP